MCVHWRPCPASAMVASTVSRCRFRFPALGWLPELAGIRMRCTPGGHLPLLSSPGVLPLPLRGEDLPVRPDPLHEQPVEHAGVDLPGQTERLARCGPGLLAGRFPRGRVVGHGARAPSGVLAAGEVGDVVPGVERHVRGHAGHLPRDKPRSFTLMPVSDALGSIVADVVNYSTVYSVLLVHCVPLMHVT